jgi:hypothetical protein
MERGDVARVSAGVAGVGAVLAWVVLATWFHGVSIAVMMVTGPATAVAPGVVLAASIAGSGVASAVTVALAWRRSPWAVPSAVVAWAGLAGEVGAGAYTIAWLVGHS